MTNHSATVRWLVAASIASLVGFSLLGCSEPVDENGGNTGNAVDNQGANDDTGSNDGGNDNTSNGDNGDNGDDENNGENQNDDNNDNDTSNNDNTNNDDTNNDDEELPDLAVDELRPDRGPLDGGTPFVVSGEGFTEDTTVVFGPREVETNLVNTQNGGGELTGTTPEGDTPGPVTVRILDDETGEVTLVDGFSYFKPLEIDTVSPSMLDTRGGAEITIEGSGFTPNSTVSVGDRTAAEVTFDDSTRLRFVAPPHEAGARDVRVTDENESVVATDALTYVAPVELDGVQPGYGSTSGGDTVVVTGRAFDSSLEVFFDNVAADVVDVADDGTSAEVSTPPGTAGLVDVRVETDGDGAILEDGFAYLDEDHDSPALDHVVPARGTTDGGERVVLTGSFEDLTDPTVKFGGQEATIDSVDDHTIAVDTPSAAAGPVDVTVEDGSTTLTASGAYTYVTPLTIDDVSPAEGDVSGGTSVTVTGTGFTEADEVRLAGLLVDHEVVDDQTLTFETPAANAGMADLQIWTTGGDSQRLEEAFHYLGDLELWNFSPTQGSVAGNTYVEIRGTGFTEDTTVWFGDSEATDVELLDANTLAVRTPPYDSVAVDVTAEDGDVESTAPQQYTYFNPGAQSGGAWGNPIDGAVNVTVYDVQGSPLQDAFVMLSTDAGTKYQGLTDNTGLITLSGPDIQGTQTITATAHGYSSATVQYVDAENITIFLTPSSQGDPPMPPPPPTATYSGEITGLEKLAPDPAPNEVLMAVVQTTRPEFDAELPDPGGQNQVVENGEYTIQTRVGELALVALGGIYNTETEEFDPLWMGTERYLTAADGGEYEVDIDLDIPLDSSIDLKYENAPLGAEDGPDTNRAQVFLDLGVDGIFGPMYQQTSDSEIVQVDKLARLVDQLEDGSYEIVATTDTGGNAPMAQTYVDGIDETSKMYSTPPMTSTVDVTVPAPDPETGQVVVGDDGLVQWDLHGPVEPDFYYVQLQTFMGMPVWDVFVSGDSRSFVFPDFPDLSEYDLENQDGEEVVPVPYPGGTFQMTVTGLNGPDMSVDNFTYDQLGLNSADAMSITSMYISLPSEDQ